MRAFIRRYVAAVLLLHQYGETAWPWHVREVWCLVRDAEPGPDSGMAPSEDLPRSAKPADHQPHQSEHPEGPSMRKIPTLFLRDPDDMKRITREVHPDCQWVLDGKGAATRKYDGTCVMLDADGAWWARREVKAGKAGPPNFRAVEYDPATGKTVGWEPIEQSAFAKYHAEALSNPYERHHEGTYELIGPKVNGNLLQHSGGPCGE